MFTEPLGMWRRITISETRTKKDWAYQMQHLLDVDYPDVEKVILVCNNFNTHVPGAFYETFPPKKAKSLVSRLEIHNTPKHGSWLNIAEIELSAFISQCLRRRAPIMENLRRRQVHGTKREISPKRTLIGSLRPRTRERNSSSSAQ